MSKISRSVLPVVVLAWGACVGVNEDSPPPGTAPTEARSGTEGKIEPAPQPTNIPGIYSTSRAGSPTSAEKLTVTQELVPTGTPSSDVMSFSFVHMGPAYPSDCVELNTPYPAPAYMVRMRVTGRPYTRFFKYNYHESCSGRGAVPEFAGVHIIPSTGVLEVDYHSDFVHGCDATYFGRWLSYVVSEAGEVSTTSPITYYQSACAGAFSLCASARVNCPAKGP